MEGCLRMQTTSELFAKVRGDSWIDAWYDLDQTTVLGFTIREDQGKFAALDIVRLLLQTHWDNKHSSWAWAWISRSEAHESARLPDRSWGRKWCCARSSTGAARKGYRAQKYRRHARPIDISCTVKYLLPNSLA
jgi:hypothetical protein